MLNKDFREFAELLDASGAEYLIVGGYALAAHGHPRHTGDLDFWIGCDPVNAERVLSALANFGFGSLSITVADLTTPENVIQLGIAPRRIDLLTTIDGVDFRQCYARKIDVTLDGLTLHFIGREDLKANKRASGRLQDKADLEILGEPPDEGG